MKFNDRIGCNQSSRWRRAPRRCAKHKPFLGRGAGGEGGVPDETQGGHGKVTFPQKTEGACQVGDLTSSDQGNPN